MFNFLRSDRPESSMRLNVFLITLACFILLLSISFYIVVLTITIAKGALLPGANLAALSALIQWSPIIALLAGIAALLSSVFYRKVQQTREELNSQTAGTNAPVQTVSNEAKRADPPDPPGPGA
jgi:hypothetical protein